MIIDNLKDLKNILVHPASKKIIQDAIDEIKRLENSLKAADSDVAYLSAGLAVEKDRIKKLKAGINPPIVRS